MTDTLTFYTNPQSRGRIARWMLEEVGATYDTQVLEYGGTMKGADYLALNPMGKVPAIKHGNAIVTETAAICAYLADAFPQAALAPTDAERANYYRWMFFAAGPIEAAITNKSLGVDAPIEKEMTLGYGNYETTMDVAEKAVSNHEYIAGDRFTAADVYFGSQIGFGLMFGSIEKRPAFEAYWGRISGRDANKRASDLDNALMEAG
jgi:glutathione S-transferase